MDVASGFGPPTILNETPYVLATAAIVTAGLLLANFLYDRGMPNYLTRKIGHAAGGLAFLLGAFWYSSAFWPIILSTSFGSVMLVTHYRKPDLFRGVGGNGRQDGAISEVWFPFIAVPVFLISWQWLQKPMLGIACLLFMAWGDGLTGLVRSYVYHKSAKGWWGSLAMLAACLIIAVLFIVPLWVGLTGAVVAVLAEQVFGRQGIVRWGDDNWAIPALSLGVILGLMALHGEL
jgi:phytol kinase